MADEYDIGDQSRISVLFDVDGTATDPTTVTFQVRHTDDAETTDYEYDPGSGLVKRAGLGQYYVDFEWDKSGTWYYRFVGTGDVVAAEDGSLKVRRSKTLQL